MNIILIPLLKLMLIVLDLYTYGIIIMVIFSWLSAFGIINMYNPFVAMVYEFLFRTIDPLLSYIRKILPGLGAIDLSPLILLLLIFFLQSVIGNLIIKLSFNP